MNRLAHFAVTALLAALCSIPARAQEDAPAIIHTRVSGGPKLGINFSKLDGQSWDGGYKTNLLGGAWLSVHGARFGVQIEGLFTQTTYITGTDFNQIYKSYLNGLKDSLQQGSFKVSYFNIPVMAQVRILNRVWLQLGAQYSGIVSVKDKDDFVKDAAQLFDKGTVAAVGGLWVEMTRHLNAGARYVMGFSDINNTEDAITHSSEKWKQRDVQVHIGYSF